MMYQPEKGLQSQMPKGLQYYNTSIKIEEATKKTNKGHIIGNKMKSSISARVVVREIS